MKIEENPASKGEGFSESSVPATPEESQTTPARSSGKLNRQKRREPRPGTKAAVVLELLRFRPGQFVGLHELMREARSGSVHSVVSTLRIKYHFRIENRQLQSKDGERLSEYRLEDEAI